MYALYMYMFLCVMYVVCAGEDHGIYRDEADIIKPEGKEVG